MKQVKAFIYIYKNSLFNVKYYSDVLKVNRRFSFKYFFILAFIATLITTTRVSITLVPKIQTGLDKLTSQLSMSYPSDLVVTSDKGEWSINQPEPYSIKTPDIFYNSDNGNFPNNLITFDHQGTINELRENDTLILINEANIITLNNQNRIEAYPLDNIPNGQLDQTKFNSYLNDIRSYLGFVPYIIVIFVLLGTLFYFACFRLLYLLFVALTLLAIGNIKGLKYKFSDYYKIGLHTITLPLTLELIFTLLGAYMLIPLSFFAINLIFGISVIYYLADSKRKG